MSTMKHYKIITDHAIAVTRVVVVRRPVSVDIPRVRSVVRIRSTQPPVVGRFPIINLKQIDISIKVSYIIV